MADIHEVMRAFASLPFAKVGHGPRHPTRPEPALGPVIEQFLEHYPIIRRDQGYVAFLECYAGASIADEEADRFVDIFGFSSVSTDIQAIDGPLLDDEGFVTFCTAVFHPEPALGAETSHDPLAIWELDFAFDLTGDRRPGVYRALSHPGRSEPYSWFTATFPEWLELLIRGRGSPLAWLDTAPEAANGPGVNP